MIIDGGNGEVVARNDYYPFGMKMKKPLFAVNDNRYLYNGKELQEIAGMDFYDYGARMLDKFSGRWFNIDPLAEISRKHSPYVYALNNPLRYIDPDGRNPIIFYYVLEKALYIALGVTVTTAIVYTATKDSREIGAYTMPADALSYKKVKYPDFRLKTPDVGEGLRETNLIAAEFAQKNFPNDEDPFRNPKSKGGKIIVVVGGLWFFWDAIPGEDNPEKAEALDNIIDYSNSSNSSDEGNDSINRNKENESADDSNSEDWFRYVNPRVRYSDIIPNNFNH